MGQQLAPEQRNVSEAQRTNREEGRAGRVQSKVLTIQNPLCSSLSWCGYLSFAPDNTVKPRDPVGKLAESAGWKSREHFRFSMALLPLCVFLLKSHYFFTVRVVIHSPGMIKINYSIGSMVLQTQVKKTLWPHVFSHKKQYIIRCKDAFSWLVGFAPETSQEAAVPICGSFLMGGGGENPSVYSC